MPIDWSDHLLLFALGALLGALALFFIQQAWSGLRRKPQGQEADPAGKVHAVQQSAPAIQIQPAPVREEYYLWMNLTAREKEIARLVAQDKTNGEIARELRISPYTVETHLKHIFHKLKLNSRKQLTRVVAYIVELKDDVPI